MHGVGVCVCVHVHVWVVEDMCNNIYRQESGDPPAATREQLPETPPLVLGAITVSSKGASVYCNKPGLGSCY